MQFGLKAIILRTIRTGFRRNGMHNLGGDIRTGNAVQNRGHSGSTDALRVLPTLTEREAAR